MGEPKLSSKDALKILAVTGLIASSLIFPNIGVAYQLISKEWAKYKRGDIGRIIKRFYKQELIKLKEQENGQVLIEISEKGKSRLLQYNFEQISLTKRRDGKMRLLIFDIPNKKKVAREMFRSKLKELGFIKVQESVFMTAYPCKKEIEFIINYLQISNNVILLRSGKTEIGPDFSFKAEDKSLLEQ